MTASSSPAVRLSQSACRVKARKRLIFCTRRAVPDTSKRNLARIRGVGVKRFFAEQGFELASEQDPRAIQLAVLMDVRRGLALVAEVMSQPCSGAATRVGWTALPLTFLDAEQERAEVTVSAPDYCTTTVIDLNAGFTSGAVSVQPGARKRLPLERHA